MQPSDCQALYRAPLFHNVPPAELEPFGSLWHRKKVPGQLILMAAGTASEVIYFVLEGSLKISLAAPDGREIVLALRGPGEVLGDISLLDNQGRSATVTTLEPCTLLWANRSDFVALARRSPQIMENLACILANRLRMATAQIQALSSLDVRGRMAVQILALAKEFGSCDEQGHIHIPIRVSQSDLGAMIGASRASVNTALSSWRKRQLIALSNDHQLTILNVAALEQEIC